MNGITKNTLWRFLGEVGFDAREDFRGDFYVMKYADAEFAHDLVITYSVDGDWLRVTGKPQGFSVAVGDEYVVLDVLNAMNIKRVAPVGYWFNDCPHFRYSVQISGEVSEAYLKRDVIRYGAYCVCMCFAELGERLEVKGVGTESPY